MRSATLPCLRLVTAAACLLLSAAVEEPRARAEASTSIEQVVARAVAENYAPLHQCFRKALAADRLRQGTLFLRVTLADGEEIAAVAVERDELNDEIAVGCVTRSVRSWRLRGAWAAGAAAGEQLLLPLTFTADPLQQAVHRDDAPLLVRGGGVTFQPLLTARSVGARQASLSLIKLEQGRLLLPDQAGTDQVVYLLSGQGLLHTSAARRQWRLLPGSAAWLPAGGSFFVTGELELLWLTVPAGLEQQLSGTSAPAPALGSRPRWPTLTARQEARPRRRAPGLTSWPLLEKERKPQGQLYLGLLEAGPRARLAARSHAGSSELLYVLRGGGSLQLGERTIELRPGLALCLPPGSQHQLQVKDRLQAVQVLAPAGGAPAADLEGSP